MRLARRTVAIRLHAPPLPGTDLAHAAGPDFLPDIPLEPSGTGYVENLVRLEAQAAADYFFLDFGGAAEDVLDVAEPPEPTIVCYCCQNRASSGKCESRRFRGAIWTAIMRQGMVSPRGSSPSRGVAATTTPNQRPRISQPSTRTSTPVSSSRHSCHNSS